MILLNCFKFLCIDIQIYFSYCISPNELQFNEKTWVLIKRVNIETYLGLMIHLKKSETG